MVDEKQLLAEYVATGSESAFRELVTRYVDLVYSTAVRLVNADVHRAQDVTQTVFADLARLARTLAPEVMLGGWLHRHTCFVASHTMRGERRRQIRERQVSEMNSIEDHSAANLAQVTSILDEAIDQLPGEDRTAILLRFFEQRDFQAVGAALGSNEEAARKRVGRAVDKLHGILTRRGVAFSAVALASGLSAEAVTAAPAGMAASISTAALATATVAATAAGGGTALTFLKIMSMTKMQIGICGAVVLALAIPLTMQYQAKQQLSAENASLRKQLEQFSQLTTENARLTKELAQAIATPPSKPGDPAREIAKLRGEVGRLQTAVAQPGPSPLSGIAANPEMMKMIRDQNKAGLQMIYKDFAKKAKLTTEQSDKLADLLADDVVGSIGHITDVLRDGKSREEINALFDQRDAALQEKVQAMLGPDEYAQYQEYTRNIGSYLTAEQFKDKMSGDKQEERAKQLYQLMQEETRAALTAAGLGPDYQTVPMLNMRNIASEAESDKSLKLIEDIYNQVSARADFLNPDELKKFAEFRTNAINQSRMALVMNRKMMAPATK